MSKEEKIKKVQRDLLFRSIGIGFVSSFYMFLISILMQIIEAAYVHSNGMFPRVMSFVNFLFIIHFNFEKLREAVVKANEKIVEIHNDSENV